MKKVIFFVLSLYLMLPIFVYNIKEVSRVHIMKYTGSFDIIYQDRNQYSDDLTFIQSVILDTTPNSETQFFPNDLQEINKNSYHPNVSYLTHSPRAPPYIV